jgi:hypothetical protein
VAVAAEDLHDPALAGEGGGHLHDARVAGAGEGVDLLESATLSEKTGEARGSSSP